MSVRTFVHVQIFFSGPAFSTDSLQSPTFTSFHTMLFWRYQSDHGRLRKFTQTSENVEQTVMLRQFLLGLSISILAVNSQTLFLSEMIVQGEPTINSDVKQHFNNYLNCILRRLLVWIYISVSRKSMPHFCHQIINLARGLTLNYIKEGLQDDSKGLSQITSLVYTYLYCLLNIVRLIESLSSKRKKKKKT